MVKDKKIKIYASLLLFLFFSEAYSIDFFIKPLKIFIEKGKNTAVFEIVNTSDKDMMIETELKKWDLDNKGNFVLSETEDIIVIPPFIQLKPKQKQLIKIAYLGEPPIKKQLSYRLILKQVPDELDIKSSGDKVKTAVQIVFHISVPVFINPLTVNPEPKLIITPVEVSKSKVALKLENVGTGFVKTVGIVLKKDDEVLYAQQLVRYVLPDSSFVIEITKKDKEGNYQEFGSVPEIAEIHLENNEKIEVPLQ
ncbi:molecular chaperone [Persephonella atlantica]|uniref:Molecular chaperone n=1 Tax=Persephonella atlantica TaxID=2699429 RepID=A0ABS1GGV0_9AQUI|nr:fimbria/pilus periplasmic chaperone [Persephonella atlantica]MBK3332085.1 molecular chaperone [Persephonella atlantica]